MDKKEAQKYSDQELIAGALKNDRHAQKMLYYKYADKMYTVAFQYAQNTEEAADILQDSFIKAFKYLDKHDTSNPLGAWLRRIVVNTAIESFKQKKRRLEVVEDYSKSTQLNDEVNILSNLDASEVIHFVNQLPEKAGLILKLYAIEGFAHHEIAESLNISVGTSKSQLSRAKELLRTMMVNAQ